MHSHMYVDLGLRSSSVSESNFPTFVSRKHLDITIMTVSPFNFGAAASMGVGIEVSFAPPGAKGPLQPAELEMTLFSGYPTRLQLLSASPEIAVSGVMFNPH